MTIQELVPNRLVALHDRLYPVRGDESAESGTPPTNEQRAVKRVTIRLEHIYLIDDVLYRVGYSASNDTLYISRILPDRTVTRAELEAESRR